tara:strand:+ start:22179 stop:22382 length:204 start_codon:yes stop_codon:yes gene_type:complete
LVNFKEKINNLKKYNQHILSFSILILVSSPIFAQGGPPPPPPPGLPIDGGLLFLAVSAIGYAIKKLK